MRFMIVDIILLVVIAVFAFTGARRGFIGEISMLIALAGGFILANIFNTSLNTYLTPWIRDDSLRFVISYLLIFFPVAAAIKLCTVLLQKFIELILLGWLNRILGLLLGVLKGLLLISLLIFVMQSFPRSAKLNNRMDHDSYLYHVCATLKDWAITAISTNPNFENYRSSLKEKTTEGSIQELMGNS